MPISLNIAVKKSALIPIGLGAAALGYVLFKGGETVSDAVENLDISVSKIEYNPKSIGIQSPRIQARAILIINNGSFIPLQVTSINARLMTSTGMLGTATITEPITLVPGDNTVKVPIAISRNEALKYSVQTAQDVVGAAIDFIQGGGDASEILKFPPVALTGKVLVGALTFNIPPKTLSLLPG